MAIRVFIFEDHWMCREALVAVLGKEQDLKVVGTAEDVDDGMARVAGLAPDVVIMDVLFRGERRGIDAAARLTTLLPRTNVIVYTEFPDEETLQAAVTAGVSGFLLKKEVQEPEVIAGAIRAVHRGDGFLTPAMTARILGVVRRLANPNPYGLTRRELEILALIADGKDNREVARLLGIEERTVANHTSNLLFKMNAKNRTEASAIARKEGIIR